MFVLRFEMFFNYSILLVTEGHTGTLYLQRTDPFCQLNDPFTEDM